MFIMFWQMLTLQMFQIRTVRLRWENIVEAIPPDWATFAVAGYYDKDMNDVFEQENSQKYFAVNYRPDSFGTSLKKVIEAVQFYYHNPDARETLPSWEQKPEWSAAQ
jgi:hypothetical protein